MHVPGEFKFPNISKLKIGKMHVPEYVQFSKYFKIDILNKLYAYIDQSSSWQRS